GGRVWLVSGVEVGGFAVAGRGFGRDHPCSGFASCFCSVVSGTVVHHDDLANLASSLHLQQRRQAPIDHSPAIISRYDNGDGSVEVRPQGWYCYSGRRDLPFAA